jgi:hypothetical protein
VYSALENEFNAAVDIYNAALELGRSTYPGSPTYEQAMSRIRGVLGTIRSLRERASPWPLLVEHSGVRSNFKDIVSGTQELEAKCLEILN